MKKRVPLAVLTYGICLVALGWIGFQSGSRASLYSGSGTGLVVVLSSMAMFANKKFGSYVALASSALLTAVFAARFAATTKPLLATMCLVSIGMFFYVLAEVRKKERLV